MANLANFLGVRSDFEFQPIQSNTASAPRNQGLHQFLRHPSGLLHHVVKFFTHYLPSPLRHRIRHGIIRANLRPQANVPMKIETEHQLRERFQDEIERLEKLLGRDLSSWKSS
jgi:adenine-specific DNA methylase